jgi:hypothetical protein
MFAGTLNNITVSTFALMITITGRMKIRLQEELVENRNLARQMG